LNLIDDEQKRKVIKSARNRTESYHQFQRRIRQVFGGVFKGKRIVSNAVSMQASRLVSNCVIAYNAMLLNQLYLKLCASIGEEQAQITLSKISPVAWAHIIFTGRYHFKDYDNKMNFEKLLTLLEKKLKKLRD
jgi:adenine-specific DNA methylase